MPSHALIQLIQGEDKIFAVEETACMVDRMVE